MIKTFIDKLLGKSAGSARGAKSRFGKREEVAASVHGIDPSLVDAPLIFPDEETLATTFDFMPLDDRTSIEYERDWADVTGG